MGSIKGNQIDKCSVKFQFLFECFELNLTLKITNYVNYMNGVLLEKCFSDTFRDVDKVFD